SAWKTVLLAWRSRRRVTYPSLAQKTASNPLSASIELAETPNMPYCPICKVEYRAGFSKCCHCLAALVASSSDADAAHVVLLWEGLGRQKFEAIVAALHGANIPSRAGCSTDKETGTNPVAQMMKMKMKTKGQASWQVFVLEQDYERAQTIARSCC